MRVARSLHISRCMRKLFSSILFVLLVGGVGTACTARGSARYSASATMPTMVYISPGVQVIEDYDEPVFYSSNVYWRFNGGIWYQSRTYTGGWVRVTTPPRAIVSIQQPSMYVHYRASARGGAQANAVKQERREEQAERREEKREEKQERREEKQERQEEKREDKRDGGHDNGKGHKK
jgi:hypothetical protein